MINKSIEIGKETIELQIKALKKIKNSIDRSFAEAVKIISKCKSKLIICGVGKSGKVAAKISATMSSVGTPSFDIAATDCSHGDLGRISSKDILMLISNSGNTEELKNIIKYANMNKIKLISIVSNKNSYLYKSSNIKLYIPSVVDAGHNIVPTSSTTAQLALGDALSIAVMIQKKFGKLDFKRFHPAGNLGQKLKTASEVMLVKNKIPFINENAIMKDAIKILNKKKLGILVILDLQKHISGVFTDGDLKRLIQKKKFFENEKIKKFMTRKPYIIEQNMLVADLIKQMNKRKITNVCVCDKINKKKIIGVIHIHDLLKHYKNNL